MTTFILLAGALLIVVGLGVLYVPNSLVNSLGAVANLLVALLTAIYAFITYRLLQENVKANKQNKDLVTEQFRLSVMPCLYCTIEAINVEHPDVELLFINNVGQTPAYDVDLRILCMYSQEDNDVPTFLSLWGSDYAKKSSKLEANDEGFYAVRMRTIYPIFPNNRKIEVPLNFPPLTATNYYVFCSLEIFIKEIIHNFIGSHRILANINYVHLNHRYYAKAPVLNSMGK